MLCQKKINNKLGRMKRTRKKTVLFNIFQYFFFSSTTKRMYLIFFVFRDEYTDKRQKCLLSFILAKIDVTCGFSVPGNFSFAHEGHLAGVALNLSLVSVERVASLLQVRG